MEQKQVSAIHWSAQPVKVDGGVLMHALIEKMEKCEMDQAALSSGQVLRKVFGNISWRVTERFECFSMATANSGEGRRYP
jgi:hypothetical protein